MPGPPSRREFIATAAKGFATAFPVAQTLAANRSLSSADNQLLDDLSRRCFSFFWEQADAKSGIARDRARADGTCIPQRAGTWAVQALLDSR